jgi:DNA-binding MarR family transcriptional regulator
MAPSLRAPLDTTLDDLLCTSSRLVADLCEPVERLGLSREEHLVLLLLWDTDGMPVPLLVERLCLPPVLAEQTLESLQRKALIERERHPESPDVWLTRAGREARDRAGKGEMCTRLRLFERDIAELRDKLQRALDLIGEEMAGFGLEEGEA